MDEWRDFLKTRRFLEEVTRTATAVIRSRFPTLADTESDDIVQDVLVKVLRAAERGTKFENLGSYLWRVCFTTALDMLEERSRENRLVDEFESGAPIRAAEAAAVESEAERLDARRLMSRMLEALPANRRRIFKLYLLGMDFKEMAVKLDWTHSKVRHLYYRGLEDLRAMIKNRALIPLGGKETQGEP